MAVFRQMDALREEVSLRLKANPEDAEALRLLGESLLDEGNLAEAIENLRKAYQLEPKTESNEMRSRDLLREALLEGLRRDFATYGAQSKEIEQLLDDQTQRVLYARLVADGLRNTEKWRPAFDQYLRLIDLEGGDRVLEVAGPSWLARRDRWIWGGLNSLCEKAPASAIAEIDRVLEDRVKAALQSKSLDGLRQFVDHFDGYKAGVAARRELIERLIASEQYLEAGDAPVARLAIVRCGSGWTRRGSNGGNAGAGQTLPRRRRLLSAARAGVCRRRLSRRPDRKAIARGTAARRRDIHQLLSAEMVWPSGRVEVTKQSRPGGGLGSQRTRLNCYASRNRDRSFPACRSVGQRAIKPSADMTSSVARVGRFPSFAGSSRKTAPRSAALPCWGICC